MEPDIFKCIVKPHVSLGSGVFGTFLLASSPGRFHSGFVVARIGTSGAAGSLPASALSRPRVTGKLCSTDLAVPPAGAGQALNAIGYLPTWPVISIFLDSHGMLFF